MSVKIINKTSKSLPATHPSPEQQIIYRSPDKLKPYPGNARIHDERQITALVSAVQEFGFRGAIIINENDMVLSGHGRLEAAKRLKLETVPTITAKGFTDAQQRAYVLADNKLGLLSSWNDDILRNEIGLLLQDDFKIETTGFSTAEIDLMLDLTPVSDADDPDELQPEDLVDTAISRVGDVWNLGKHRLICDDALQPETYKKLLNNAQVQMVITDPPYNVPIHGHVCGAGKIKHAEFVMASGEMDSKQFTEFLATAFSITQKHMQDGAIFYGFMDWRHLREMLDATEPLFGKLLQFCVWAKDNGGMGSFYRSQHELVFVFKKGEAKHINNFELGQHGRYRTNLWNYPGASSLKGKGHELLKIHPTVKPAAMIADAIRDCSHHGGIVLDPFAGSGTVILSAERTGRCARAIEIDPKYVDAAINRWQRVTGEHAIYAPTGMTYAELKTLRLSEEVEVNV